jgi:addiction module HigA family antidote
MTQHLDPIPPGEILAEEFMKPLGITQMKLAQTIDIPQSRVSEIVRGTRSITADTALRLATYFETSPDMWLSLQADYDLRIAQRNASWKAAEKRIKAMKKVA